MKDLHIYMSLDSIKVYKSLLKHYKNNNNTKKFKMVQNHVKNNFDKILNHVNTNSYELTVITVNSRINILNELVQIAEILVNFNFNQIFKMVLLLTFI